ncbi:hypothetical protein AVEN_40997-1, partial [Araneus ventricosus]
SPPLTHSPIQLKLKLKLAFWGELASTSNAEQKATRRVLSASALVIAVESSCPDEEDIEPCTCQEESGKSILRCKNIPGISVLEKVAENSDGYRYDESAMQLEFPSQPKPSGTPDGAAQVSTWRERNFLNRRVTKLLRCKRNYTMKPLQTI